MPHDPAYFIGKLLDLGRQVRSAVQAARRANTNLAAISKITPADTIYQLDIHAESVIEQFCQQWSREFPLILIAEGIAGADGTEGKSLFPHNAQESDAPYRLICDPIDGTRGLMYDKRSAWFLAGIAPNHGPETRLSDIFAAVQVELPTAKQSQCDVLWAIKAQGANAQREDLSGTKIADLPIRPSQADNISHGFASISNFFPGTKELAAALMERIAAACLQSTPNAPGIVFDDQYISTGGQFYELITGHDRFNADLRPLFYRIRGLPQGLCVHPYDLAALLIAIEAGIQITDGLGGPLDGPLDTQTGLNWAGFANPILRARIEPVMTAALHQWLKGPA